MIGTLWEAKIVLWGVFQDPICKCKSHHEFIP